MKVTRFVWVLVCFTRTFNTDACEVFVFDSEHDALLALAESQRNCEGWHSIHRKTLEV